MKLIIDTDPGHDDAMALLYALKRKDIDMLAVTTVAGNSTIENTTRNAQYVLNLLGRADVPLYSGAPKPLRRPLVQAVVHGTSGLDGIDPSNEYALTNNAPEKIVELVRQFPGEITLLALGPLTNIARAIQLNREAMRLVREIVIMGGAFTVPGNKNRVAEFNMYVDPEAAAMVVDLPVLKTFVPLDACNEIQLQMSDFCQITNKPIRDVLIKMNAPYIKNLQADMNACGALMYDVLAAYFACNPSKCKLEQANVQIEAKGKFTRGMTIIDQRPVPDNLTPNAQIVTFIPSKEFKEDFIETLSS